MVKEKVTSSQRQSQEGHKGANLKVLTGVVERINFQAADTGYTGSGKPQRFADGR